MVDGCGADTLANELIVSLTAGHNFTIPLPDLSGDEFKIPEIGNDGIFLPINKLTNADLTLGASSVGGTGTFDILMAGFNAHLKSEFEKNRISGAEYTKAYIALTEAAMANGVQFLLQRDQSYWQAVTAQLQAQSAQIAVVTGRIALETAKVQLRVVTYEALNAEANYALSKMKLATENENFCTAKYTLDNILPIQKTMLTEQVESQRGQTMNTRTDGTPILGSIGKQRDLYDQQITSYKRDAEVKAAKLFTDAWITQKTIDEGLLPPDGFTNMSLDTVLTAIKANNNLD